VTQILAETTCYTFVQDDLMSLAPTLMISIETKTVIIIIASLARDVAPIDHDHAAQHCPTAIGWMYPSASMA